LEHDHGVDAGLPAANGHHRGRAVSNSLAGLIEEEFFMDNSSAVPAELASVFFLFFFLLPAACGIAMVVAYVPVLARAGVALSCSG
jgi:hypothetical protein